MRISEVTNQEINEHEAIWNEVVAVIVFAFFKILCKNTRYCSGANEFDKSVSQSVPSGSVGRTIRSLLPRYAA